MTGLDELFELYSPSDQRAKVYARKLAGLRSDILRRAVSSVIETWDKTSMPPIGLVRRQYHHEMAESRKVEEAAERRSRMLSDRGNSPHELRLFALIRGLGARGVLWCFAQSRWVGVGEEGYDAAYRQDYGNEASQQGRASTLAEAIEAWDRYAPRVPEPAPFSSVAAGIDVIAGGLGGKR